MFIVLPSYATPGSRGRKSQTNWAAAWERPIVPFTIFTKSPRRNSFLNYCSPLVVPGLILTVLHLSKNMLTSVLRIFELTQRPNVQRPGFQKQVISERGKVRRVRRREPL